MTHDHVIVYNLPPFFSDREASDIISFWLLWSHSRNGNGANSTGTDSWIRRCQSWGLFFVLEIWDRTSLGLLHGRSTHLRVHALHRGHGLHSISIGRARARVCLVWRRASASPIALFLNSLTPMIWWCSHPLSSIGSSHLNLLEKFLFLHEFFLLLQLGLPSLSRVRAICKKDDGDGLNDHEEIQQDIAPGYTNGVWDANQPWECISSYNHTVQWYGSNWHVEDRNYKHQDAADEIEKKAVSRYCFLGFFMYSFIRNRPTPCMIKFAMMNRSSMMPIM